MEIEVRFDNVKNVLVSPDSGGNRQVTFRDGIHQRVHVVLTPEQVDDLVTRLSK
jgi:hypothetical protein